MTKYSASSLEDIADHFEVMADTCADTAARQKSKSSQTKNIVEARTWQQAADFLRHCELKRDAS